MSTYKRWFPSPFVSDGITVTPGALLWQKHRRQYEKCQEQLELRAWEGEGGSPAARNVALQASVVTEAPRVDMGDPSIELRAHRLASHPDEPKGARRRDR